MIFDAGCTCLFLILTRRPLGVAHHGRCVPSDAPLLHMTCVYPPPHVACMYPPPRMTWQVLNKFGEVNLAEINSKGGFFMGIIKRFREQERGVFAGADCFL